MIFGDGIAPRRGCPEWWLGLTAGTAADELGAPSAWFPSAEELPRVGMWPCATLWFDRAGHCHRARLRRGAPVSIAGVSVLEMPYAAAVRALRGVGVELAARRRGLACMAEGAKVAPARRWGLARRAVAVEIAPPDDISVRIEGLWAVARRALGPRRGAAGIARRWAGGLPGGSAVFPESDLRLVEDEMSEGNWAAAVDLLVISAEERGIRVSPEDRAAVNEWASELGAEERFE